MKIAFIGTYPPRQCGIGTFTRDLYNSVIIKDKVTAPQHNGFVVALNDFNTQYAYPEEVKTTINQEQLEDYIKAAKFINLSGADVCILEHEFGIFGGQDGVNILPLLYRLDIPFIVTLHTILKSPSYNQKAVLQQICGMAQKIVVMSNKAISFLKDIYDVPAEKIAFIEHGVPDLHYNSEKSKKEFKLEHKKVLFTFGFIGRNKGIETVIKALPEVVKKHPDVIYIVQGKTHPNVLRHSGEEYRIFLMRMVKNLGLEKHVVFLNEFIEVENLFKYLSAADIYITPYLNEAQITSGTLSYAVGVGTAAISTPYWHAQELLADGRGRFFDFNDEKALATLLTELLDNPKTLAAIKEKALSYGKKITWPKTGEKYTQLAKTIAQNGMAKSKRKETLFDLLIMPPFSLTHINRLTDDTGIIQHAKFGIPNLKEGYCLDDNARALLMVLMAHNQLK
ncbi:MAG: glycosyltransferase family 4 protein, partial [Salinivirgaceae bacterium]